MNSEVHTTMNIGATGVTKKKNQLLHFTNAIRFVKTANIHSQSDGKSVCNLYLATAEPQRLEKGIMQRDRVLSHTGIIQNRRKNIHLRPAYVFWSVESILSILMERINNCPHLQQRRMQRSW